MSDAASSGLPEDVAEAVDNFTASVTDIEGQVRRLQRAPWAELCRGLSPLESARLHLMVAYTVNTLFYMYLKTQGIPAVNHPVREELERVKSYIRKVKEVSQAASKAETAEKRQVVLNASAAQRFISHALGGEASEASRASGAASSSSTAADKSSEADPISEAARETDQVRGSAADSKLRKQLKRMEGAPAEATSDEPDAAAAHDLATEVLLASRAIGLGSDATSTKRKTESDATSTKRKPESDATSTKRKPESDATSTKRKPEHASGTDAASAVKTGVPAKKKKKHKEKPSSD